MRHEAGLEAARALIALHAERIESVGKTESIVTEVLKEAKNDGGRAVVPTHKQVFLRTPSLGRTLECAEKLNCG